MCFKNIENMQFIDYVFKICNNVNSFAMSDYNKVCSQILFLNFGPLNNILGIRSLQIKRKSPRKILFN